MAVLVGLVFIGIVALAVAGYLRMVRSDWRSLAGYRNAMRHLQRISESGASEPACDRSVGFHVRIVGTVDPPANTAQADLGAVEARASEQAVGALAKGAAPVEVDPEPIPSDPPEPQPVATRPRLVFVDDSVGPPGVAPISLRPASPPPFYAQPAVMVRRATGVEPTSAEPGHVTPTPPTVVAAAFEDASPLEGVTGAEHEETSLSGTGAARSLRTVAARPSVRWGAGLAAAAVVAAVAVVVAQPGSSKSKAPPRGAASGPIASGPTTVPARPTPTTLRPRSSVLVASTNQFGATYTVSSGPVDVSLVTSRPCWVELKANSDYGSVVFEGTLSPGQQKVFDNLPGMWLRVGNPPGLVVEVDGTNIGMPGVPVPYDVTVNDASSGSTG
jgi:Domain of unknown function (DUF4115)